jgi:hypothetical protein
MGTKATIAGTETYPPINSIGLKQSLSPPHSNLLLSGVQKGDGCKFPGSQNE